jgi:hypothetical protein
MAAAEQKKSYKVIKTFKGINTKSNRTAIEEDEFSWLENAQPIGYANLKITPNYVTVTDGAGNAIVWSNTVTHLASTNIDLTDYVISFQANGGAEYYNISTKTKGTIAAAGTFSAAGIQTAQWKNERTLILDPQKGYFTWDGNNVVSIGSVGIIAITNPGSGYTGNPTVVIGAPIDSHGVQANATVAVTSGAVSLVQLQNAGSGYGVPPPSVTITGGGGTNATAIAGVVTFATGTASAVVISGGTGYTNSANTVVTFSGGGSGLDPGSTATGTAVLSGGQVIEIIMTNPGSGYTNAANLVVTVSGGGGTGAVLQGIVDKDVNVGIASFSGRVFIASGRTIYYSAAGSYTDFTSVSAGSFVLTDETLHGNIQQILSANNFLYIFGDDSINVFSDVRVDTTGVTLFTNTNISASVGSRRANAIFPYFRSVLFLNDYGVYALVGSTTSKISDPLDGMFLNIDYSYPIYAGQVLLNNILCAAFNFRYFDGIFTNSYRYVQAVFFEKKWFITSQGDNLAYITSVPVGGVVTLFGSDTTNLYRLYQNTTSQITSRVQTALLPMGDPIRSKQALKIGIEATSTPTSPVALQATVDSENQTSPPYLLASTVSWTNNNLQIVGWSNNSNVVISWASVGYELFKTDASMYGKYLGITVTSSNPGFTVNGFEFEHELRVRF